MIYLIPMGGLANRMRAIDSAIALCRMYKNELTIVWEKNKLLNCAFEDLFQVPVYEDYNIRIINTIPFQYFPKKKIIRIPLIGYMPIGLKLKTNISNSVFREIYSSKEHIGKEITVEEMDELFYSKTRHFIHAVFSNTNESSMLHSTYRFCKDIDHYSAFVPVPDILESIESKTASFSNTVGLHIRRTDHEFSRKFSTTDKFLKSLHAEIEKNPGTSFFLSTDSNDTKQVLVSEFGERILTNKISGYNRNSRNAIRDALLDLYCLSNTRKIIGSYMSSFSQVAADIGQIEIEIIQ